MTESMKYYESIRRKYPEAVSKDQFYQIAHISKATALHLLQNGLVPCKDTGKKTRRYTIRTDDIEFDYDLWTTEDGKCMVRVKITGEVTEVDRKVMRILRAEEKRLRRSKQGVPISGTEGKTAEERASVLSLSYVSYEGCEDLEPYWLIDSSSMEESVMFWMSEKEFRATLTPRQLDIYLNCIIGGQSKIDYAAANNMQRQSVYNAATLIMKKAKYFFKKF